jgi:hypothetical protein
VPLPLLLVLLLLLLLPAQSSAGEGRHAGRGSLIGVRAEWHSDRDACNNMDAT